MVRFFRRKKDEESEGVSEAQAVEAEAFEQEAEAEEQVEYAVERTRRTWFGRLGGLFRRGGLDDELWDELEETLIGADAGVQTATKILDGLRDRVRKEGIRDPDEALSALKDELAAILQVEDRQGRVWVSTDGTTSDLLALRQAYSGEHADLPKPAIILVVGVNGTGKTTSIGKLAHLYRSRGKRVVLAAGDTFRAAAIDQLKHWGERAGVEVVAHQQGADPAAVIFDALVAAEKRDADVVIIDTAGRLHTKVNLMEELRKVYRVIQRKFPDAPHEVLLVIDATTGQNALQQAKYFTEAVNVTAVLLAKLDGTAKGGVIFAVCDQLGVPVRFVGTGEKAEDLAPFRPRQFVNALFE